MDTRFKWILTDMKKHLGKHYSPINYNKDIHPVPFFIIQA